MGVVAKDNHILIERLQLGPFGTNTYILSCQVTKESLVIDAPGDYAKVLKRLEGTNPKYILMTHDHMDHVGALKDLRSALMIPIAAHQIDTGNLPVKPDILLKDDELVTFGNIQLKVLHTPGHTPGSLCFLTGTYLISGDTLFPGGPGKTGTPDDLRLIVKSITNKIFVLPDETEVYPGHGEATIIGEEKKAFEIFSSRSHNPNLCGDVLWASS